MCIQSFCVHFGALCLAAAMMCAGCDGDPDHNASDASGPDNDGACPGVDAPALSSDAPSPPADAGPADQLDAGARRKRVFVTRGTFSGRLGGVTGADQICQTSAETADLGGVWKAWLSDSQTDAVTRLGYAGPWYFVDESTKVFDPIDSASSLPLPALILVNRDEYGELISTFLGVWTGTLMSGLRAPYNCGDWAHTGAQGTAGSVANFNWSGTAEPRNCEFSWRLFCFET